MDNSTVKKRRISIKQTVASAVKFFEKFIADVGSLFM